MGHLRISGRADLLRALADVHGSDADAFAVKDMAALAALLDLHPQPPAAASVRIEGGGKPGAQTEGNADDPVDDRAPTPAPGRRPPLQARFFVVLESSELPARASPQIAPSLTPLTAADCGPLNPNEPLPIPPLVPRTRLWPALRRSLSPARSGGVDVPALTRRLSRAESIRRLPHATRHRAVGEVWVVFDIAQRLIPYELDFADIIDEVRRLLGAANVRLWRVSEVPDAVLSVSRGRAEVEAERVGGRIPAPPAGTPVLILGDLGLLSRDGVAAPQWVAFCRRLATVGARPVAWVPVSPQRVTREAARYAQVHCLGAGDLRPVKPHRCAVQVQWPDDALRRLLIRIACCVRVEPALLRSLRLLSPDTAAEPGLEALVWAHPTDVRAGYRFCEIATPALVSYRAAFAVLGTSRGGRAEQDEILRRMLAWHAYRGRSTESVEVLVWQSHTGRNAPDPESEQRRIDAVSWAEKLVANLSDASGEVMGYARDLLARQGGDAHLMKARSRIFSRLWALTEENTVPFGLLPSDVADAKAVLTDRVQQSGFLVVQESCSLRVEIPNRLTAGQPASVMPLPWIAVPPTDGFDWSRSDGAFRYWLPWQGKSFALPLGDMPERATFNLVGGNRRFVLGLLNRPSWATEWGVDSNGLYALAPSAFGELAKLYWTTEDEVRVPYSWPPSARAYSAAPRPLKLDYGLTLGADLQYGLYLDVPFGSATQRFRWIEPGEFDMGSPEGEEGRDDDEGPRHVVRLTEGFWLAETACSQSVWESVMGRNPSEFTDDPQNPVEQVSWDDVQGFLREVERRLPGVKADLPTEAEWEYACRAGSETAFSWGDGIAPDQANYKATESYANGPTGEYRERTVPVKSYAPNAWGLYQMHGNVWEWCEDGPREYDGAPQVDPRGPEGGEAEAPRAVRGGSWFHNPHGLRAAYRSDGLRAWRDVLQGFRFSLRSTSQQRGAERPPEAAVAPEGPQGKSPAPGRGRGEGVSKGSPARRDAGPATKSAPTKASRKKKR